MSPRKGEKAGRVVGGAAEEGDTMARMKQMYLDIIESQEADEEGIINAVPISELEVTNAEVSSD